MQHTVCSVYVRDNVSAGDDISVLTRWLCVFVPSEAEQTAAPETTPEGEENAPAGSENK